MADDRYDALIEEMIMDCCACNHATAKLVRYEMRKCRFPFDTCTDEEFHECACEAQLFLSTTSDCAP